VDSIGSCVGILSIEHTNTPDPLKLLHRTRVQLITIYRIIWLFSFLHARATYLLVSLCKCASYRQNGLSMVVHSFMNSIEPPGSADISQMPSSLCGSPGAPSDIGIHGSWEGVSSDFASGTVNSLEQSGAQYMPLMMTEAYGAICVEQIT